MSLYSRIWKLPVLNQLGRRIHARRRFTTEVSLLSGKVPRHIARPSIVFFTVHKAASIYAAALCRRLAAEVGYKGVDFSSYSFKGGETRGNLLVPGDLARRVYQPEGFYYGPFRAFNPAIPWLDRARVILHLRDPRDVLVSSFYSMAYSHYVPSKENPSVAAKILANREATLQMEIDAHVLANAAFIREVYQNYITQLVGQPFVWFSKYEQMIGDFGGWLEAACRGMGISVPSDSLMRLSSEASFQVEENISKHKRQVQPGDYLRKLKPETIARLNSELGGVLERLDYARCP